MTGRPSLFGEPSARLSVRVPETLAQRLQDAGHNASRLVASTLESVLRAGTDKAALLAAKLEAEAGRRATAQALYRTTQERNAAIQELQRLRAELGNESRAARQLLRNAPPSLRPRVVAFYRQVRALLGDADAQLAEAHAS